MSFSERASLPSLPLVGRAEELAMLSHSLDTVTRGVGATLFLAGDAGVGKTRLALATAEEARRRGWHVAHGRAYPVESGVPYALFADAFVPLLQGIEPGALAVLSRGSDADLAQLFPAIGARGAASPALHGDPVEARGRLLWHFTQFLGRLSARAPVLVILENLQWADPSSVELLHFTARHLADKRVFLLTAHNPAQRAEHAPLAEAERSLVAMGVARLHPVRPFPRAAMDELLHRTFGADTDTVREFADRLHARTRGNAFFVEEMLKSLVATGRLREAGGRWTGWDVSDLALPSSVREALVGRLGRLGVDARAVADVASVLGTRMRYETLAAVSGLRTASLVDALDLLRREHVLEERLEDGTVVYDFRHPLLQDTLYAELGHARARLLHARVADALEALYAGEPDVHADELAFHFARGDAEGDATKAARYLAAAGRAALARYATPEALRYLEGALALRDRLPADTEGDDRLVADLARARQRAGDHAGAIRLWERDLDAARLAGDDARLARVERRLGLASYWAGDHEAALAHYDAAFEATDRAGDGPLAARVLLARGACLQAQGRPDDARREHERALAIAERNGHDALLAASHRALAMLHLITGDAERARAHGAKAIAHAAASGQQEVEWSAHYTIAVLAGLTGEADELRRHVREARRIAHALHSPALDVRTAEVEIEYASGIGDWEAGLAQAARAIPVARALAERGVLARLLVWTGLMHLWRGADDEAKRLFDEAWKVSGASRAGVARVDVHSVVPAHTGLAAYQLARRDWPEAIRYGEAGIGVARAAGYDVWAIHRLLGIVIEASIWHRDWERARRYSAELRAVSSRMGHRLGLAWAAAADALILRFAEQDPRTIDHMLAACDELEAIPFVMDAARMRRNAAQLLAQDGDRERALEQLRRAHEVFVRIGAEAELRGTRDELRALGARPPSRIALEGDGALTGREREIARLVARRKSNKEIGGALGISSRTVSTHLSNIFAKLGVTSRGELTDRVRELEGGA